MCLQPLHRHTHKFYSPVPRCYRKHDSLAEAGSRISNIEMQDCAERVRRCTERKSILAHESEYCSRRGSIRVGQSTCLSIAKTMIGLDRAELMRTDTKRAILRNNEKRGYKCVWNSIVKFINEEQRRLSEIDILI